MTRRSLPDAFEGMVVNGKLVMPSQPTPVETVEVPSASEAQQLVTSTRRKLADLPAMPKQLNTFSAVLVLSASGLSEDEISLATGLPLDQLKRIRKHDAYKQLQQYMIEAVKEQASEDVVSILADGKRRAAKKIVALTEDGDHKVALAASKDVLDRTGHAATQKIDMRSLMESTFRIEIVDKRGSDVPVIEHGEP